ncbi:MAG TPA: helix-turn-helix domain-containing protein [Thermoleophilaceae bacterium]|nr:helix-turn-helix domain-containing protein [Thermoleophilaceae bacterium]
MKPIASISDPRIVRALAHPMRLEILSIVEKRTASPKEIAREIGAPLTHVSYHVRQLAQLGLIKLERTTPRRGAVEHHYSMETEPRISEEAWREAPEIAKQALIGATLGHVSDKVNAAAAEAGFSREGSHLQRLSLELDDKGWDEASSAMGTLVSELERIHEDSLKRREGDHGGHASATAVVMLFEAAEQRSAEGVKEGGRWHRPATAETTG